MPVKEIRYLRKKANALLVNPVGGLLKGISSQIMREKIAAPAGALVYTGQQHNEEVTLQLATYDTEKFELRILPKEEINQISPNVHQISWLDVYGLHDIGITETIGQQFDLDPLFLEDILDVDHLPKLEQTENYLFLTLKMISSDEATRNIQSEQMSIVLGKDFLITFQEKKGDIFQHIRNRLLGGASKALKKKADYLFYLLVDKVVDHYLLVISEIGEEIESMEEALLLGKGSDSAEPILRIRKKLIYLRKFIFPLRDAIQSLIKEKPQFIRKESFRFLNDVYDHMMHASMMVESYRDLTNGLIDLHMNQMNTRMNNVMKTLTIIATIFIPLTFIAGIYGMNFQYMPELAWEYGYPMVWGIMLSVTMIMAGYMKRKGWF